MSGYASRKGLSEGVHDPLSARVVAFESGRDRLYLPPERLYVEGGYEVESSPFGPTAAEQLVRHVVRMLYEL
jgi:hypothetical protein